MKIEKNEKYNFLKITPDEGKVLTSWDKKDIMKYSSSTLMYCPANFDAKGLYEITEAEDIEYKKQQEEARKAEEAKRMENR